MTQAILDWESRVLGSSSTYWPFPSAQFGLTPEKEEVSVNIWTISSAGIFKNKCKNKPTKKNPEGFEFSDVVRFSTI